MPSPFLRANPVEVILQNFDQRVNITLFNELGDPVDATALRLQVMDVGKTVIYNEDFFTPPAPPRIIKPAGTVGQYYINWGDPLAAVNLPAQTETNLVRDLFFVWRAVGTAGTEPAVVLQVVKVVDPRVMAYLPRMRLQMDKALKIIDEEANIFTGYTDAMLLMFAEGGLNMINGVQPSTCILLENFPFQFHGQLLIDAATLIGLQSQLLFAIDTDLSPYSDQGYSFNVSHAPGLQSFMSALQARLDKLIALHKMDYITKGSITLQAGVNFRFASLISASTPGALFRGYIST